MNIIDINTDNIVRTYSGKSGCMCGCKGTYKVASKHSGEFESWQGDVSDIAVKRMYNKFVKNADDVKYQELHGDEHCFFIDDGNRNNVIYFRK